MSAKEFRFKEEARGAIFGITRGTTAADFARAALEGVAFEVVDLLDAAAKDFGRALAAAAQAQTRDLVIYNAAYMTIGYPGGDVPLQFGVCTDVIIRAYRALGIDLQELVHLSRPGRSDTNIDHRRTDLLRGFFATYGEHLLITPYIEDYLPGDIVTFYRPQNKSSTAHIALVSDVMAPSGRPMIVHNRGWGVQLEDALFVDQITGHYRFRGLKPAPDVAMVDARPKGKVSIASNAGLGDASAALIAQEHRRLTVTALRLAAVKTSFAGNGRMGLGLAANVGAQRCEPATLTSKLCRPVTVR